MCPAKTVLLVARCKSMSRGVYSAYRWRTRLGAAVLGNRKKRDNYAKPEIHGQFRVQIICPHKAAPGFPAEWNKPGLTLSMHALQESGPRSCVLSIASPLCAIMSKYGGSLCWDPHIDSVISFRKLSSSSCLLRTVGHKRATRRIAQA